MKKITNLKLTLQKYYAKRFKNFIKDKATIRSFQDSLIYDNFFLIENGSEALYTEKPISLTLPRLKNLRATFLNDTKSYESNFQIYQNFWKDSRLSKKEPFLKMLDLAAKDYQPEEIYQFSIANFFNNHAQEFAYQSPHDINDLYESKIYKTLYRFQKDALKGVLNKINSYNGCILADSVGLGKTYVALATIKYFNLHNDRVLVLAPKKLVSNWETFNITSNNFLNPFADDQITFTTLAHTDLSRHSGRSGSVDLKTFNWSNYDLVVIDESHYFRNKNRSHYDRLLEEVIKNGAKTKVLMLSATPVNMRTTDLLNQLMIITAGEDNVLQKQNITSIRALCIRAQANFNRWQNSETKHSSQNLYEAIGVDYFKLLDIFTIARSKKQIQNHYEKSDLKLPKFIEENLKWKISSNNDEEAIFDYLKAELSEFKFPIYKLIYYVKTNFREKYVEGFSAEFKEKILFTPEEMTHGTDALIHTNLLKRLESSLNSFKISLENISNRISKVQEIIANSTTSKVIKENEFYNSTFIDEDENEEEEESGTYLARNRKKSRDVKIEHLNLDLLQRDLQEDQWRIASLLRNPYFKTDIDLKLEQLRDLIIDKITHPFNEQNGKANRKVLVFSFFKDTVIYLYEKLAPLFKERYGLISAFVSGSQNGSNSAQLKNSRDINEFIINFSPVSKARSSFKSLKRIDDITILFATDCISEGQDLQDCDLVINYDIHWNPIRIIQRFGRIDRIGSQNQSIKLINLWPNIALDNYIKLISRITLKGKLANSSATADNELLSDHADRRSKEKVEALKALRNSKLEEVENNSETISLTKNSLEPYKSDYINLEEKISQINQIPYGVFSITELAKGESKFPKGTLFLIKDLKAAPKNRDQAWIFWPYSLVYVPNDPDLEVIYKNDHQLKMLELLKRHKNQDLHLSELYEMLKKETNYGKNMSFYQEKLRCAISSIKDEQEEENAFNIFSKNKLSYYDTKDILSKDFELIAFMIFK